MNRYVNLIQGTPQREVVLLQSYPCIGNCIFCDYTQDNNTNTKTMIQTNKSTLQQVQGSYSRLEIANSGSFFELPLPTILDIQKCCKSHPKITTLQIDSRWEYKNYLQYVRELFTPLKLIICVGVETWKDTNRKKLGKIFKNFTLKECKKSFDGIYLMIGYEWQTTEDILTEIKITADNFKYAHINIYKQRKGTVKEASNIDWNLIKDKELNNFE
jgi:uncharacterized Fe-S cluster-containing MiaB family protein